MKYFFECKENFNFFLAFINKCFAGNCWYI